jgi:hypothetical protein
LTFFTANRASQKVDVGPGRGIANWPGSRDGRLLLSAQTWSRRVDGWSGGRGIASAYRGVP